MWVCSQCKRTYPTIMKYCPKCNKSNDNNTSKIDNIKKRHEKFISTHKKIQMRYKP